VDRREVRAGGVRGLEIRRSGERVEYRGGRAGEGVGGPGGEMRGGGGGGVEGIEMGDGGGMDAEEPRGYVGGKE